MTETRHRLGIVAGGGIMPRRLAEAARAQNYDVLILAISGQADPHIVDGFDHSWIDIRAVNNALKILREKGVKDLLLAGKVRRPSFTVLLSDPWAAKFLTKVGLRALGGDDGFLKAFIKELESSEGLRVLGPDQILKDLASPLGCLTSVRPDKEAEEDIQRGITVAQALGRVDVGQSVVVQHGLVLGVEAIEGTAALLERCSQVRREGVGGVLVKISKPGQERRADLPTIGIETVHQAVSAGLKGIAVEANNSLILDRHAVVQAANAAGLFVIGVLVPH